MAGNHVLLETIELTQSASSVTFDNIPQTGYTDLKVVVSSRTVASSGVTWSPIRATFNGTSTSGLSFRAMYGNGTGASATNSTPSEVAFSATSTNTANTFSNSEFTILNYTSNTEKQIISDSVLETNAVTTLIAVGSTTWADTSAVTSIVLPCPAADGGLFAAGSTFSLYGIAAVGTTPVVAPLATGGNIVANDGTYWYHAFLTSGNFVPQTALTCDTLVIAGGGAGGGSTGDAGGGGGAGGYRLLTNQATASLTNYLVTIGAGGTGVSNSRGTSGTNSSIVGGLLSISSTGGGGGGGSITINGANGGSGGGGGSGTPGVKGTGNAGGYSPVEGYDGANAYGGGGGASAAATGASGANGSNSASTWATATNTGVSGYYAGGGSAGTGSGSSLGGGGRGEAPVQAGNNAAGIINTGSGGGATWKNSGAGTGSAGGSGIVIIRYAMV